MKKFGALLLAGMMIFGSFGTAFAKEIKVTVDGTPVVFTDAVPFVDENAAYFVRYALLVYADILPEHINDIPS